MLTPTTDASALFLLLLSLVCLGSWANTFKLTGKRWSYELFYIDFAIGALVLALILAFTLGTSGDLPFSDRMLVAGRTAQAWLLLAGFIFNFGNVLLVASISLVGMAAAFPLAVGTALVIASFFHFRAANALLLVCGIILTILAVVVDARACHRRVGHDKAAPQTRKLGSQIRKPGRGILTGVLGGVVLGLFYPVAENGMDPEFGVGPYAGVLLFCIGLFFSMVIFHFFFLNMAIGGSRVRFADYIQGKGTKHLLGFAGGAIFTLGLIAAALVSAAPSIPSLNSELTLILPLASALLAIVWGITAWKEFAASTRGGKPALAGAAVLFAGGLVVIALSLAA